MNRRWSRSDLDWQRLRLASMIWLAAVILSAPLAAQFPPGSPALDEGAAGTSAHADALGAIRAVDVPPVRGVASIRLTVSDLDRAVAFFSDVLSFQRVDEREVWGEEWERLSGVFGARLRIARLRLGREEIELTEFLTPKGRPIPLDSRSNDGWFQHIAIVVSDMDRAYERLRRNGVEHASTAPQRLPDWNPNAGGIEAFYFKDPDGHVLEVISFPAGKGDPRWQRSGGELFLGIDHTAIVVCDTESSLRLYQEALGLRVAGESSNHGTEQEHLNNVFGARLRITALRAADGPGIEFLEYLVPTDGRVYPTNARGNDLIHWETTLLTDDVGTTVGRLVARGYRLVSSGVVVLREGDAGYRKAAVLRDADGHALRLVER